MRITFLMACAGLLGADGPRRLVNTAVDESNLVRLTGGTHPMARPEFDRGIAPSALAMERMLLLLKRSPEQDAALKDFMERQLDRSSPDFHQWLTPEEFGERFGPAEQDLQVVVNWLRAHRFHVTSVSRGRTIIEFSGTARDVLEGFHASIHKYVVNGEEHWANATDPRIPAALSPIVAGVKSLHNFWMRSTIHVSPDTTVPSPCGASGFQESGQCFGISPFDFAAIYNILPLWQAGIDGSGVTIAVLAASNIAIQDARDFRQLFGLPPMDPVITVNGADPGLTTGNRDVESEAFSDVEWAAAVAPGATINLVVSKSTDSTFGFDLSAVYAIDNNVALILSGSYGICEDGGSSDRFYRTLWQQAAAQGITVLLSNGDTGSACREDASTNPPAPATHGLKVFGTATTAYNIAVGGTDFDDFSNAGAYWNSANDPVTLASAKGYVPETTWNESCVNAAFGFVGTGEANCNEPSQSEHVLARGAGGGRSAYYAKPSWQTGPGVPDDGRRDVPDVSLFSGSFVSGHFFLICESDHGSTCGAPGPKHLLGVDGTSLSVQAFAGIMALVDQYTDSRQGAAAPILYQLAAQQNAANCDATGSVSPSCIFHDVTSGTIAMPCAKVSPNCTQTNPNDRYGVLAGYDAGFGYDLATGLGSVNGFNLVTSGGWPTANIAVPVVTAVGNAATLAPGPIAPGSIAAVTGSFPIAAIGSAAPPLPPILSGLSLKLDGLPVPILNTSQTLVSIQVPWELAGRSQASLTAILGGVASTQQTIDLAPYAPGIFSVQFIDPRTVQIYCTGLGPVSNQPSSGGEPSGNSSSTLTIPRVIIGGVDARVLSSALVPGHAGLYAVTARTSALSGGVSISIGGVVSNVVSLRTPEIF